MNVPPNLIEHYDMVALIDEESRVDKMQWNGITNDDVRKHIKKLKIGKSGGLDGIKPDIYFWMVESDICVNALRESMNGVLRMRVIPENWRKIKTVLIPKNNKPKYNEFRPIALTGVAYKLFMSIIKDNILKHVKRNRKLSVFQAGFTEGRRIEDCLFIFNYCIKESFRQKKSLIVTAIDFSKAFDSIKREKLVACLKKLKCDEDVIDVLTKVYTNDSTDLWLNGREIGSVDVSSGIKQGCTVSPLLFILLINSLIEEVEKEDLGFKNEKIFVPVLFFADDGLLLTESVDDMKILIEMVEKKGKEIGLEINRNKSMAMIYNMNDKPVEINGIIVKSAFKYLGLTINDSINCFKLHKEKKLKDMEKMANITYSVIAKSCNRLMMGKAYWKNAVMPSLMYGESVLTWNKDEIERIDRTENAVWRKILGAPGYTPIAAMRGDIRCISMIARDMKVKLSFAKYLMNAENEMLREIFRDMLEENRDKLVKIMNDYLHILGIGNMEELNEMSKGMIVKLIEEYDECKWKEDLDRRSTLKIYQEFKREKREEKFYDNTEESVLMFKARSNCLKLNWRLRFENGDVNCKLCNADYEETIEHFLMDCMSLNEVREEYGMINRKVEEVLLFVEGINESKAKKYIKALWKRRAQILSRNEEHG